MLRPLSRVTLHGTQPFSRALFKNLLPLPVASVCALSRKYSTAALFSANGCGVALRKNNNLLGRGCHGRNSVPRRSFAAAAASDTPQECDPSPFLSPGKLYWSGAAQHPRREPSADEKCHYAVYALDHNRKFPGIKWLRSYTSKSDAVELARSLTTHYSGQPSKDKLEELRDQQRRLHREKAANGAMQELRDQLAAAREEASEQLEYTGEAGGYEYVYTFGEEPVFEADLHPFIDAGATVNGVSLGSISGDSTRIGVAALQAIDNTVHTAAAAPEQANKPVPAQTSSAPADAAEPQAKQPASPDADTAARVALEAKVQELKQKLAGQSKTLVDTGMVLLRAAVDVFKTAATAKRISRSGAAPARSSSGSSPDSKQQSSGVTCRKL